MTKQSYAETAIKEFKKLGRHVTNVETIGNQKELCLRVFYREKRNINMFDKVMKTASKFPKLAYSYSTGVGFKTKAGYTYSVTYFLVKRV
ncbi:MAG: hypothetical protein WCT77_01910 [Bacteroidota bacterium]|jgi:hypothetical protein